MNNKTLTSDHTAKSKTHEPKPKTFIGEGKLQVLAGTTTHIKFCDDHYLTSGKIGSDVQNICLNICLIHYYVKLKYHTSLTH